MEQMSIFHHKTSTTLEQLLVLCVNLLYEEKDSSPGICREICAKRQPTYVQREYRR